MSVAVVAGALWIGILTSISPCPLATNIAAVSYISSTFGDKRVLFLSAALYTIGRMAAYTAVAFVVVESLLAIPTVSFWLQVYFPKFIGPLLILLGLFLTELVSVNIRGNKVQRDYSKWGPFGAVAMGFLFALAFCPVSAALFFGSLVPLAIQQKSSFLLPLVYGIGTALPVIVFAVALSLGSAALAAAFNAVTRWERRLRIAFGIIIILSGIYMTITHVFGIQII